MTNLSTAHNAYALHSQEIECSFSKDHPGRLVELTDRQGNRTLLREPASFCTVSINDTEYWPDVVQSISPTEIKLGWSDLPDGTAAELLLILQDRSLEWRLSMAGQASRCFVRFPFLGLLSLDDAETTGEILTAHAFCDSQGRSIFRHADWPLPIVWRGADDRTLTLLIKELHTTPEALSSELWNSAGLKLVLAPEQPTVLQAELTLHQGGWRAAFDLLREHVRSTFDLSEYRREDFAWYQDQLVQHFTFLYGREILNLDTGQFELGRFLDEGNENFGGYSGFLIWGVYPRIGVDERTQWDFFDDFPGGRAALREMAREARQRGVRFFIPYKPWDRSAELHGHETSPDYEMLAKLVQDVEADGVFLDTMSAIDRDFRAAIDRVRPGVVFCSEGRAKGRAFEIITSSWEQSPNRDASQGNWAATPEQMPGVDLWRFIFPEHRLFVINRHSVGDDRIRIIQRGFFSGMGWVVWQDIFGLVLTYAPDEARLLKKCAAIAQQHRRALWSEQPTPLVDTLVPHVYANEFPGEEKRIWTFYNEDDLPVDDYVIQVAPRPAHHFVDVWNDQEVEVDACGKLRLALEPKAVGAVVELPQLLRYDPQQQRVVLNRSLPNSKLQLCRLDNTTVEFNADQELALQQTFVQERYLARLLMEGEVLDQIMFERSSGGSV